MDRTPFWLGIVTLATINGIFSPALAAVFPLVLAFSPAFFLGVGGILFLSSLILATATIIASGIPAALYERVTGQTETNALSLWIWVSGMAVLSIPAVLNALKFL